MAKISEFFNSCYYINDKYFHNFGQVQVQEVSPIMENSIIFFMIINQIPVVECTSSQHFGSLVWRQSRAPLKLEKIQW